MAILWRPSEIIVNEAVRDNPITLHILQQNPSVTPEYVTNSKSKIVRAASPRLQELHDEKTSTYTQITYGKFVLYISPSTKIIGESPQVNSSMICPEFEKLILNSNGCYYKCDWCFLKSTFRTNQNYITVRVDYDNIKTQISKYLKKATSPVVFNTGEMGDSLALEHLTKAGQTLIPWFADQPNGYMYMLTKSTNVDEILNLRHNNHTILAWSLNANQVSSRFELGAPDPIDRIKAAEKAQKAGYPIRIRIDPIIPIVGWQHAYRNLISQLYNRVKPEVITLGTLRFEPAYYNQKKTYFSDDLINLIDTLNMSAMVGDSEGKISLPKDKRIEIFKFVIDEVRKYDSEVPISLCKETHDVWHDVGLDPGNCCCVCKYGSVDMSNAQQEVVTMSENQEVVVAEEQEKQITYLAVTDVERDPDQPRKYFKDDDIDSLAASLKEHGFINPITVRLDGDKKIIIAGEQRWRAATKAGIERIPCIICVSDKVAEIALVENMLRSDLTAIEKAEGMQKLIDSGIQQKDVAQRFGLKPNTISEIVSLNSLPDEIKNVCRNDPSFAIRELKKIASVDDAEKQKVMFESYKKKKQFRLSTPSETVRSDDATLNTAIKLMSSRLDTVNNIIDTEKKEAILARLRDLHASIGRIINPDSQ